MIKWDHYRSKSGSAPRSTLSLHFKKSKTAPECKKSSKKLKFVDFRMKSFSQLLVRELQAELTAREVAFKPKDRKAVLQKV